MFTHIRMGLTGIRKEQLDYLLLLRKQKHITAETYASEKAKLERKEAGIQKTKAKAQAKRDAKKAERKAARQAIAKKAVVTFDLYRDTKVYKKVEQGKKKKKIYQFQRNYETIAAEQTTHTMERFVGESMKKFRARAKKEIEAIIADKNSSMRMGSADGEGETWTVFSAKNMKIRIGGGDWTAMSREKPYALEGLDCESISNDGNCVPESLSKLYPKWKLERVMKELGPGPHYPEQVLEWCQKKDITCLGCDLEYSIMVKYVSRNNNHTPCYFVCHDNHFYIMKNAKGVSIMNTRVGSRKPEKEKETIERSIVVSDELDLTMDNTLQIVSSGNILRKILREYIDSTYSVPKYKLDAVDRNSLSVKSFAFRENLIKVVRFHPLIQEVNTAWGTSYKSIFEIVADLLSTTEKSCMNSIVMNIWKPRQHFAHLYTPEDWENVPGIEQTWDANKYYSSALKNMPCGWLIIPMSSFPRPYSGGVKDAIYYIETKNTMPCKGNGFYTRIELEYLHKHNIEHTVIYEILGKVLPKEHFHPIIEKCMKFKDFKHILNTLCGILGKTEKLHVKGRIGVNEAEAVQRCMETGGLLFDLNDSLSACANITVETLNNNNLPMYMQIHGYAAVQLADMIEHLKSKGAIIRGYNTDSITFKTPSVIPIDVSTDILGGWKSEIPKPYPARHEPMCRTDQYHVEPIEWIEKREDEFASWDEMIDWILNGDNVCIQGGPGYGKSTLLRKLQERIGDSCIIMAPTNNAALNIGGNTIHHIYKIAATGEVRYNQNAILGGKTHEITDEISMVGSKYYLLFQNPKTIKIAAGDFDQLLPVGESDAEGLQKLATHIFNRKLTLTIYKRGDSQLLDAITKVRLRQSIDFQQGEKGNLHLCMTNKQRHIINAREMAKATSYETMPKNDNIYRAYAGMPVISKTTPDNHMYVNNQRWWVKSISMKLGYIELQNDTKITIPIKRFIEDFLPGYAITIHASQSLTLSEPYTVWITKYSAFSQDEWWRLVLVAVSRATSLEQVGINQS